MSIKSSVLICIIVLTMFFITVFSFALEGSSDMSNVLNGIWGGEGDGSCENINPFQNWSGIVTIDQFYGSWSDGNGNNGNFSASRIPGTSFQDAAFEGTFNIYGDVAGSFFISFSPSIRACFGEWHCLESGFGSIRGKK